MSSAYRISFRAYNISLADPKMPCRPSVPFHAVAPCGRYLLRMHALFLYEVSLRTLFISTIMPAVAMPPTPECKPQFYSLCLASRICRP